MDAKEIMEKAQDKQSIIEQVPAAMAKSIEESEIAVVQEAVMEAPVEAPAPPPPAFLLENDVRYVFQRSGDKYQGIKILCPDAWQGTVMGDPDDPETLNRARNVAAVHNVNKQNRLSAYR